MTIQESIRVKFRKSDYLAYGSWLLMIVLIYADNSWFNWLKPICLLLFVGSGFYTVFYIQCPKCHLSVFWTTLKNKPISLKRVPDKCMACGCNYLAEETNNTKIQSKNNNQ